jgi:hypothetical protein
VARFRLDNVSGEIEHPFGELKLGNLFEVRLFIANFIRIPQRQSQPGSRIFWRE